MASANRTRLALVRESTIGVTPGSPRMRTMRITKESLNFAPNYINSDELRSDRMLGDPIKVMQASTGGVDFELSYPNDNSPLSELYRSAFFNPWVNTPTFDNDGTADSVITDAGTVANTYSVVSGGAAVVAGHMVRATGFAQSANNQIFKAASSSSTTIVGTTLGLVAETAPAAAAKLKVVGFQGASGDITATSTGLASTTLDFTTLGLVPGKSIKIGGTATTDKFATAADNDWVRITAITAHAITCDNLPATWATDAGAGKTIKVWFGDHIFNGTTRTSLTIEKGFLGQAVPTYIVNTGMVVETLVHTITSKQKITGTCSFIGMGGGQTTAQLGVPDAATTGQVMAANANVGRLSEAGSQLTSPNWALDFSVSIANNNRTNESVDQASPVDVVDGECTVTGSINTYFGSNAVLAKFYNGTQTSIMCRVAKNSQALIWQLPHVTLDGGGNPVASGKNTDVMAQFNYSATLDPVLGIQIQLDRVEYFES
jgi:hypothetical protein